MTAYWGPLGWMTLHSISMCYPVEPTVDDRQLLDQFMSGFVLTITCPHCNSHFSRMFADYKIGVPTWNNSRYDLFIAICKMHNIVNVRLNKPIPKTVGECLAVLENSTKYSPPSEFRKKYIEYLTNQWKRDVHIKHHVDIMNKINEEYWNKRETPYSSEGFDTTVDTTKYSNQPVEQKITFSKLKLRKFRWIGRM